MRWLNDEMSMADAVDLIWKSGRTLKVGYYGKKKCVVSYDRKSRTFSGLCTEADAYGFESVYTAITHNLVDVLGFATRMTANGSTSPIECIGFNKSYVYCSMPYGTYGEDAVYRSSFGRDGCDNAVAIGTHDHVKTFRRIKERLEFYGMDAFVVDLVEDGRHV